MPKRKMRLRADLPKPNPLWGSEGLASDPAPPLPEEEIQDALNSALREQLEVEIDRLLERMSSAFEVTLGVRSGPNYRNKRSRTGARRVVLARWANDLGLTPRALDARLFGRTAWKVSELPVAIRLLDSREFFVEFAISCGIEMGSHSYEKIASIQLQRDEDETIIPMDPWENQIKTRISAVRALVALRDYSDGLDALNIKPSTPVMEARREIEAELARMFAFTSERSMSRLIVEIVQRREKKPRTLGSSATTGPVPQRRILEDLEALYSLSWTPNHHRNASKTLSRLVHNGVLGQSKSGYTLGSKTLRRLHSNRLAKGSPGED